MDIRYDIEKNVMQVDSVNLEPQSIDMNFIGVCSHCDSNVVSISYHSYENGMMVAGKCNSCNKLFAIIYDKDWTWKDEELIFQFFDVENSNNLKFLDEIDNKKLKAVFTPAEINAMYAKVRGEKYVRQYLYRARKKYADFKDLFGLQINI